MRRLPDPSDGNEIDLRGDFHGRVAEFVSDQDRRWFANTPGATTRYRAAVPHEFCDPRALPECRPTFTMPPILDGVEGTLMVAVQQIAPGLRLRHPYFVIDREVA
jgi:hypothetical protein